jgi:hypothetical protein
MRGPSPAFDWVDMTPRRLIVSWAPSLQRGRFSPVTYTRRPTNSSILSPSTALPRGGANPDPLQRQQQLAGLLGRSSGSPMTRRRSTLAALWGWSATCTPRTGQSASRNSLPGRQSIGPEPAGLLHDSGDSI